MKDRKRFELTEFGGYIVDNLTGIVISVGQHNDIVDIMNHLNETINQTVEKYDEIVDKYNFLLSNPDLEDMLKTTTEIAVENIEENIKFRKVLDKYDIDDVNKLDQILFWREKW